MKFGLKKLVPATFETARSYTHLSRRNTGMSRKDGSGWTNTRYSTELLSRAKKTRSTTRSSFCLDRVMRFHRMSHVFGVRNSDVGRWRYDIDRARRTLSKWQLAWRVGVENQLTWQFRTLNLFMAFLWSQDQRCLLCRCWMSVLAGDYQALLVYCMLSIVAWAYCRCHY